MPLLIYDGVLIACVPFCRLRAPVARRHGRYETEGLHAVLFFALVVDYGSGMHWLVFTGDDVPRLCSSGCLDQKDRYARLVLLVMRLGCVFSVIPASFGMDQNDSYPHGWFCVVTLHLALYFSSFAAGP